MEDEVKRGLKIFLTYWLFFALLGAFNFYNFYRSGSKLSLVVAAACAAVFIGWAITYFFYFRAKR